MKRSVLLAVAVSVSVYSSAGNLSASPPPPTTRPTTRPASTTMPATAGDAASLEAALWKLDKVMRTGTVDQKKKAFRAILPTKADLQALFPKYADRMWPGFEKYLGSMVQNTDKVAAELTRDQWTRIDTIDARKKDSSGWHAAALRILPPDIPVFSIVKRGPRHTAGSSSYLYLRGRWIFFRGFGPTCRAIEAEEAKGTAKPKDK